MLYRVHFFPGLCLLILGLGILFQIARWLIRRYSWRWTILVPATCSAGLLSLGYLLEFQRVVRFFPVWWATWLECAAIVEAVWLMGLYVGILVWRRAPEFRSPRRRFLRAAGAALVAGPVAATGFGILMRNRIRVSEMKIPIPNLPKDLDGLRIVQVTDVHLSPFLSESEFARAIDMANETRANIALMTGDLISRVGDPLDACLKHLARLRADAGVIGCLGNHEIYTKTEDYVTLQAARIGIKFLRFESKVFQFGNAEINFAGVDYQMYNKPYLVGAEQLVKPGAFNVMLSHNPDVFPEAASKGYDLTIAGHTHGGQVNVEILHQNMNVARYYTPYVRGLYREVNSSIYVSSGIGTIGVPVRIGAPPEISLIQLCAT
jgi:predicted MPP superfamily phosphohydrolase